MIRKMKNNNSILTIIIVILSLAIVGIIGYIAYERILNNNDNTVIENKDDKTQENNNIVNDINNNKHDESSFVRQTKVNLVEEPNCTGNSSSLIASIEENGNISISQNGGASIVTPGNAKYLFRVGKLACDVVSLYYITNDNELYVLDNPKSDVDQTATKVIDAEVIEFLGTQIKEVEDGYNNYLKVLLKDNTIKYINYMTTVK